MTCFVTPFPPSLLSCPQSQRTIFNLHLGSLKEHPTSWLPVEVLVLSCSACSQELDVLHGIQMPQRKSLRSSCLLPKRFNLNLSSNRNGVRILMYFRRFPVLCSWSRPPHYVAISSLALITSSRNLSLSYCKDCSTGRACSSSLI